MQDQRIARLRSFRSRVRRLTYTAANDCKQFFDTPLKLFFRLPSERPQSSRQISVTSTATALMSLAVSGSFANVFEERDPIKIRGLIIDQLKKLFGANWTSSSLSQDNAFTASIVIRAIGILLRHREIESINLIAIKRITPKNKSNNAQISRFKNLDAIGIAQHLLKTFPESIKVGEYPPTAAIAYWLLCGAINCNVKLSDSKWEAIAKWLSSIFYQQMSLVSSNHTALMDPISLAMAASACGRLSIHKPHIRHATKTFPTRLEIDTAINLFMNQQTPAGTWNRYFPLFHYPTAGSNHCWHIEVLEALLHEFPDILNDSSCLSHFELAVSWIESHRIRWQDSSRQFFGWNSGGQLDSLARGEPESWATGVVHMFLDTLANRLDDAIRMLVLSRFGDVSDKARCEDKWHSLLDSKCKIAQSSEHDSVKASVKHFIIDPIANARLTNANARYLPSSTKRSALLFGPPGTGKTGFVRAVAEFLGWNFVEITPTEFLVDGIDGVYAAADALFEDLGDLDRTVVFFDEMDAMLQGRVDEHGQPRLQVHQQFMTTCMLPHLARLYESRKVVFFFATNFFSSFDKAITRAGRFDMLLFMGPPTWADKVSRIELFARIEDKTKIKKIRKDLLKYVTLDSNYDTILSRATFAETRSLFHEYCQGANLENRIVDDNKLKEFRKIVMEWSSSRFSLLCDKQLRSQYDEEHGKSEIRW